MYSQKRNWEEWTVKHPALARVFSIVLAIMSLIMLLNGAVGFGKADVALQ